ncbi:MAG: conserved membrane protein of unknown function [Promethearchaeota archaeon]|nr:MAG: conserved membrane protein of unknown function [Candidatus Lokiarchaeota archaeon]
MLDNWLVKSKLKDYVELFVKKTLFGRITPNQLTLLALVVGILSAICIYLSAQLTWFILLIALSIVFMVLSFLLDAFDGALARLGEPSEFGGILDMFCDRLVEVAILIALISTEPSFLMWPGIFSLGAIILCITMFLIVGGSVDVEDLGETQKVIYYRRGLMERSETLLFLIIITLLIDFRWILLYVFAFLVFLTALLRLWDAYKILISFNCPNNSEKVLTSKKSDMQKS